MYGENHIKFVQIMLGAGRKSLESALNLYEKWECDRSTFQTFIGEINERIGSHGLKLLKAHCEVVDLDFLVLINTVDDGITTLQQHYSSVELEYFYLVIHELVSSEEKRLERNFCLNLASSLPSRTHYTAGQAENLLRRSTEQGYFVRDLSYVYIGARGIWEFMPYIQTKYRNECTPCNLCSEMVLFGSYCGSCDVKFHNHCLSSFLRNNTTCSSCEVDWTTEPPIRLENDGAGNYEGESDASTMETGD